MKIRNSQMTEASWARLCPRFTRVWKSFNTTRADLLLIGLCVAILGYFLIKEPLFVTILGSASIACLSPWYMVQAVPILNRCLRTKPRFWHIVTLILTLTALLTTLTTPAHAIFLSGLEQFFVSLAAQTSQAGGATNTLNANVIGLIFNLIRGIFLLLVAAAALFAYNQAQQGNDWRPIVTQVGLAFAVVIAIDVVTFIFIGDGTGRTGT